MSDIEFLGPYRIGETLGRGGMGSVFAAAHEKTGQRVAVKLIAQHYADEPKFRRRFDAEVKTLQRLRHDGIVRLIGFGEEKGQLFYSMELVDGEPLQKRIRREKKIDWRPTLDIAIQICSALKHAHDIGVIHRDLKPANLILTPDDTVKLVDFGIAKLFGDGEQTMAGSVLGTADYMAPEQAVGTGITSRSDLYSLGSVLYAMLTGRPPFTGKSVTQVIESVKRDRPVPLDLVNPDLPEALVELIHELLEKDPQLRPPTALAVMNRLKAMRAGLQRQQTVVNEELPTRQTDSPIQDDSKDTGSVKDDSFDAATGVTLSPNTDGSRPRTRVTKGSNVKNREVNRQDRTVAVEAGRTVGEDDPDLPQLAPPTSEVKSHFQTVDEAGPSSGVFDQTAEESGSWWHLVAIGVILTAMIVGATYFIVSTQRKTAAELIAIWENPATDQVDRVNAAQDFVRRFPDDERYPELYDFYMNDRIIKKQRLLNKRLTKLEVLQQGWLDAMEIRLSNPPVAAKRLQAWMNVHETSSRPATEEEAELIELAQHELKKLDKRRPIHEIDPRAAELIRIMRERVEQAPLEEVRRHLEGIAVSHPDGWAKPARDEADRLLQTLDEFANRQSEPSEP